MFKFKIVLIFCSLFFISCKENIESWFNRNYPIQQTQTTEKHNDSVVFYTVKWVSDGDTFWVNDGSEKGLKIRLIGIDAPESVDYGDKLKQEFGEESHQFVDSILKNKKVKLEYDIQKFDKYGRTLAYAFLEDGTFINQKIVANGYAFKFNYAPNLRHAREFIKAEDSARVNNLGLWKSRR